MSDLFNPVGLHILAGGQFGSEGKGILASWLAMKAIEEHRPFMGCITSAGPNSGHTSYFGDRKIVLKQLPTFAVHTHLRGMTIPVYFSAGAIIDGEILVREHLEFPEIPIFVHPNASVVSLVDKTEENYDKGSIFAIAGTRSGTGAVQARKIKREPTAIYFNQSHRMFPYYERISDAEYVPYFMEISQGFSLGINDPTFYPHVTSRECTFMQGMADARIASRHYSRGYLCFRTFPIRVGDADGHSSGGWYPDQDELSWEDVGVAPEYTTVTKRIRRVATFSWSQFKDSTIANAPTHAFLNFMNYLDEDEQEKYVQRHREVRREFPYYDFIYGYGDRVEQVNYQNSARVKGL